MSSINVGTTTNTIGSTAGSVYIPSSTGIQANGITTVTTTGTGTFNGMYGVSGSSIMSGSSYNAFQFTGQDGKILMVIDVNGDTHTIVNSFVGYTKARTTDSINLNGTYVSVWDALYGLPGVKVKNGRHLTFGLEYAAALELYLKHDGFAGLSMREFVSKTVGKPVRIMKPTHFKWYPCGSKIGKNTIAPITDDPNAVTCKRCRATLRMD